MKSFKTIISAGFLASALALAGCGGGSEEGAAGGPPDAMEMAKTDAMNAISAANTMADGLTNESDEATVMAARMAITAAVTAIGALDADDRAEYTVMLASAENTVSRHEGRIAEAKRQMTEDERIASENAAAAMAAMAAKLYAAISMPTDATSAETRRNAAYGTGDNADDISVLIGTALDAVNLSEDKKTMVAENRGWEGMRYAASPDGGGTYEAMVYSNVGNPTEGLPFNEVYTLENGVVAVDTSATGVAARVSGSNFDQDAGRKTFPLPDPNPIGATIVTVTGNYHGVPGTYTCTPGTTATCAANVAASGFQLGTVATGGAFTDGGGAWMFRPSAPTTKVMSVDDAAYASYGWWIHEPASGDAVVSAFHDFNVDTIPAGEAVDVTDLSGTATYSGGAAGKYALSSSTGGTNDAGHFTADAMLEADFNDNMISGTIDGFIGADGESRDWSVELKEAAITPSGGAIARAAADDTVWTIDGTAAAASGEWSGSLRTQASSGVPGVATGTFYSEFGRAGKMVGGFGANAE